MTRDTKPCKCGHPGCEVVRREGENPAKWKGRDYAGRTCANKRERAKMSQEERAMRSRRMIEAAKRSIKDEISAGALVTHSAWLYTDSGRIKAQRQAHGVVLP